MALHRRWLLILFTLMLGGGQLFAASREERAYAAALQAFDDKFYPLAETRLTQFLQTYRKSTNAPMVVLLLAQSEYYKANYAGAAGRLSDPVNLAKAKGAGLGDRYVYWQAEAQFAQGDLEGAAQTFVSLTENYPNSPLALSAVVEAAAAYAKLGEWTKTDSLLDSTDGLFQRMAQRDPAGEQVSNGRLLQSESKCEQQDFTVAIQILNLLNPAKLTRDQGWKRADLLYRSYLGVNDLDAALAATTNLLQIARSGQSDTWATNLAESVSSHARVLEQQGALDAAAAALQENLSTNVPVGWQQQTILKLADLAVAQKNLTNAESVLETNLVQFPDSPAMETVLLTLGELYLKDFIAQPSATNNHLAAAQAKLDQFLTVLTNSPLRGKAYLARGWCGWLAGQIAEKAGDAQTAAQKNAESLADFGMAAQLLPVSEDLAVARFKMGDAQFALTNYYGAQTNYEAVLTDFSALPQFTNSLAGLALYQILRARLALHDENGVDEVMRQFLGQFSTNEAVESLLLDGEGLTDFAFPAEARKQFLQFERERTNSPLLPEVAFAISRTFEREQNWRAAVTNDQAWLKAHPTNELRPQVEYARDWAVAQGGDEPRALGLFTNFTSEFPANTLTPLAYWWVADYYFRQGTNLLAAELKYETIFQNFPTNDLACRAQFMAGRAAMGRFQYSDAKPYFFNVMGDTNCPDDLRDQARFGYCEALRQLASSDTNNTGLQEATNILAQMTPKAATNIVGAMAWSETGDCDLQLGALDAATNAYTQALNSPAASQELRSLAQVGLGIVLEKKAEGLPDDARKTLLEMAMKNYQGAFDPDVDARGGLDTESEFWKKKAGLQILALNAKTGTLTGDALNDFISNMERIFPQLKDSLELKRPALKN